MSDKFFDDDPTRRIDGDGAKQDQDPFSAKTVRVGSRKANDATQQATQKVAPGRPAAGPDSAGGHPLDDLKTRMVRPGQPAAAGGDETQVSIEPVVGWLVVMGGPGKGASLSLAYGVNSVGRGADQGVALDFGDDQITRGTHFSVAYDARHRNFFVQHGGGQNLTYLNDQPVLAPTPLSSGDEISVGGTLLRFVAFCGDGFDWADMEDGA